MKIIIFAGGTGKRFWPASRKAHPKQFQEVIDGKPLIRLKYEYLRLGFKAEDIFLSTGIQYTNEVKKILPELPEENFIFEPDMRDTGPAIGLAIAYVNSKFPDEILCTQWSDHHIKDPQTFVNSLKLGEEYSKNENKVVLIAVPARFASPHRGYIKFQKEGKKLDNEGKLVLHDFIQFVEKPSYEIAESYIKSGDYAWNPGYWIGKANQFLDKYKEFAPEIYNTVNKIISTNFSPSSVNEFSALEKKSADYIFAERLTSDSTKVISVDMGWSDVGEWIALKETLEDANESNVSVGNNFDLDSKDTLIYNIEKNKLVATIGLEGMIVVNTPDIIAVFHKNDNAKLKEFLKKLEEKGDLDKYL